MYPPPRIDIKASGVVVKGASRTTKIVGRNLWSAVASEARHRLAAILSRAKAPSSLRYAGALHAVAVSRCISLLTLGGAFAPRYNARYHWNMTAAKVIEEILHLPSDEQSKVLEFAFEFARNRPLCGAEMAAIAQKMVNSKEPSG